VYIEKGDYTEIVIRGNDTELSNDTKSTEFKHKEEILWSEERRE